VSAAFVPDASTAIAWVHPAQATPETEALLTQVEEGAELVVPALWFAEVANALLVLERRKRLTARERREALERLTQLQPVPELDGPRLAFSKTSELATTHGLSVYDATYLELALRRRLALATRDEPLRAAAKKSGIKLLL
jgi:predicted nucleic acid-binding protein